MAGDVHGDITPPRRLRSRSLTTYMETAIRTVADPKSDGATQFDFLTAEEVGRHLGIAKASVYARLARGDLSYHRVGRLVRIHRQDLDAFIVRTRVEARPPHRHVRHSAP